MNIAKRVCSIDKEKIREVLLSVLSWVLFVLFVAAITSPIWLAILFDIYADTGVRCEPDYMGGCN